MKDKDYFNKVYSGQIKHNVIGKIVNKFRYSFYKVTSESINKYKNYVITCAAPGRNFLEIGIGADGLDSELSITGSNVTAIDISDEAIKNAMSRKINNVNYECTNAEQTSFVDDKFDVVYGKWILHHLNMENIYREISRLVKPDGKAIFLEPLGSNPFIRFFRVITPNLRVPDEHPLLEHDLILAKQYFNIVKYEYYHFLLFLAPFCDVNFISKLERFLLNRFYFLKYFCWQVIIILERPIKD